MAHPLGPRLKRLLDDSHQPKSRLSVGGWIVIIAIAVLVLPGVRRITESMALAASDKQVAPATTAEAHTEVSGTVTGEGGIPVGGADVFVIRRNPFSRDLDNQTTLVRQGQTDAKGQYHFSVELKDLRGPVRWGFEVWAVKADHSELALRMPHSTGHALHSISVCRVQSRSFRLSGRMDDPSRCTNSLA